MSGCWILQNRQSGPPIGEQNGAGSSRRDDFGETLQCATGREVGSDRIHPADTTIRALRILEWNIGTLGAEEVTVVTLPAHVALRVGPWSDDVRTAIRIHEIVSCTQISAVTVRQIENETGLPVLKSSCHPSRRILEQELVRTDWQFDCSIGTKFLTNAGRRFSVIQCRAQWIGESAAGLLHGLAEAVRR